MITPDVFALHGGALDAAARLFPAAPRPWLDLSTGINPVPYPIAGLAAADWARLPEAGPLAGLERAAAARYRVPAGARVVAAPGTQAIIQRLPALAGGRSVRILGPAYGEFARVFRDADARVEVVPRLELLAGADAAVVINPNNPDGRLLAPDALMRLAPRVGTLVVDEAFADALPPHCSLVPRLPLGRTIVLRSFGKMYGLAGLRLGFAVVADDAPLRRMLGPWAVSGPAVAIGTRALADEGWLAAAAARLAADGARLAQLLARAGAVALGHTPLFRLVRHPAAPALFRALAGHGILCRPFDAERSWLRFGLPGCEADWARLDAALRAF